MSDVLLADAVALSHEFGTIEYVRGGGGNSSAKNEDTLWVKPSGTTLGDLTAEAFVALNRAKIEALYETETPAESTAREALVKEIMSQAIMPGATGRPSVEAPLHNSFQGTFVVHVHPAVVNGMTCAEDGEAICRRLFPDAMWIEYIDPGYTLCMVVRKRIEAWREVHGGQDPELVIMKNHGIFVAADTADGIRALYGRVMSALRDEYVKAGISEDLLVGGEPPDAAVVEAVGGVMAEATGEPICVIGGGTFDVATGPLTPDHIVYHKSYPLQGEATVENVRAFMDAHGYWPRVIDTGEAVYGCGTSKKAAVLALELALDGAIIVQLAEAFGGVEYMTDAARDFIDNWEVEAYRRKQMNV